MEKESAQNKKFVLYLLKPTLIGLQPTSPYIVCNVKQLKKNKQKTGNVVDLSRSVKQKIIQNLRNSFE